MAILEDRGVFWWNDEKIPRNQFAPDASVGGKLTIEDNGSIRLELDAIMSGAKHPFESLTNSGKPSKHNIQGLLNGDDGYVLLLGVVGNGGTMKSNNVSNERYMALNCLVGKSQFMPDADKPLTFRTVILDLAGFEEWLWMQGIEIKRTRKNLRAKYSRPHDHKYVVPFGKVSIVYDLSGPYFGDSKRHTLNLMESASVRITPSKRMLLEDCQTHYQHVEELLILLTSSDYTMAWPTLVLSSGKRARLYFMRFKTDTKPPAAHECLILFPSIAASFGSLLSLLIEKREQFGPGFYLYLGTRRGMRMFVEHRFVNLIWGLEAFDRRGRGEVQAEATLQAKIDRILGQVSSGGDRRWLRGKLRHAAEPNLADRLFTIFSALPLPFETNALRKFCGDCQGRRNDISHFGGMRLKGQKYNEFMRDLNKKSDALAALYHFHLLTVIGIDQEHIDFAKNHSWPLSRMAREVQDVGILKKIDGPVT